MKGQFTSSGFRFRIESSDWATDKDRGFHHDFEDEEFDIRLTNNGKIPDLQGAPIASWLLARLARLLEGRLGLEGVEHVEGGGYYLEFVVESAVLDWRDDAMKGQLFLFDPADYFPPDDSGTPIASFAFYGDMMGAAVMGRRSAECDGEQILEAFASAILAAPDDIAACEVAVWDPEWEFDPAIFSPVPDSDSLNHYGWDGFQFLGMDNIQERHQPPTS